MIFNLPSDRVDRKSGAESGRRAQTGRDILFLCLSWLEPRLALSMSNNNKNPLISLTLEDSVPFAVKLGMYSSELVSFHFQNGIVTLSFTAKIRDHLDQF